MGDDDSSCRLSGQQGGADGTSIFMLNTLEMKAGDAMVLGLHQPIADIRDWFSSLALDGEVQQEERRGEVLVERST